MQAFLKENGITTKVKFIADGSLKSTWRLYNPKIKWFDNPELWELLNHLGFRDFDGTTLTRFSGNGGIFSIFARHPEKTLEFV
jgi:hypothetical protein